MTESKQKFSKRFKITVSLCAAVIMILSFLCGFLTHYLIQGKTANTLSWLIRTVEDAYYFDEGDGNVKTFDAEDYADVLVSSLLDKYSAFYTKDEYADIIATSKGNNYGVGISFLNASAKTDLYVFKVVGNSPAYHAGIKDGDKIVAGKTVAGERTDFTEKQQILDFLFERAEDESFKLFVERDDTVTEYTLAKRVFVKSFVFYYDSEKSLKFENSGSGALSKNVYEAGMSALDEDTAYISLSDFDGGAAEQIKDALAYMKERGRTKLIFDLRDNGGGYMSVLSGIASCLTYQDGVKKPVIAYAKDKKGKTESFNATGDNFNRDITKIVVLANGNTASASECLIGAMLYYGKAFSVENLIIEGSGAVATTYGKGIMQTTYLNYMTGEAVKLTTAFVYQPDCRTCIHGVGIVATNENSVPEGNGLARALEIINQS